MMIRQKRNLSLLLAVVLALSLWVVPSEKVSAGTALPPISTATYISTYTQVYNGKIYAYTDSTLTRKTGVYSVLDGTVAATGTHIVNGNYVVIKHSDSGKTIYSFYCRLNSVCVKNGAAVEKGTKIGGYGRTTIRSLKNGSAGPVESGTHLHFAIVDKLKKDGSYSEFRTIANKYVPKSETASAGRSTVNSVTYENVTYYDPWKYVSGTVYHYESVATETK